MTTATAELTKSLADELLQMPDGDRFEVVDGQLMEREMGAMAGWVAGEVFGHLRDYAKQHGGWAFGHGVGEQRLQHAARLRERIAA